MENRYPFHMGICVLTYQGCPGCQYIKGNGIINGNGILLHPKILNILLFEDLFKDDKRELFLSLINYFQGTVGSGDEMYNAIESVSRFYKKDGKIYQAKYSSNKYKEFLDRSMKNKSEDKRESFSIRDIRGDFVVKTVYDEGGNIVEETPIFTNLIGQRKLSELTNEFKSFIDIFKKYAKHNSYKKTEKMMSIIKDEIDKNIKDELVSSPKNDLKMLMTWDLYIRLSIPGSVARLCPAWPTMKIFRYIDWVQALESSKSLIHTQPDHNVKRRETGLDFYLEKGKYYQVDQNLNNINGLLEKIKAKVILWKSDTFDEKQKEEYEKDGMMTREELISPRKVIQPKNEENEGKKERKFLVLSRDDINSSYVSFNSQ